MKTEWNADEIKAAWAKSSTTTESCSYDRFMSNLTARKLRDDCPVMFEVCGDTNITYGTANLSTLATNVRALITVEEAREIALKAIKGWVDKDGETRVMGAVDILLDAYQYGPDHE